MILAKLKRQSIRLHLECEEASVQGWTSMAFKVTSHSPQASGHLTLTLNAKQLVIHQVTLPPGPFRLKSFSAVDPDLQAAYLSNQLNKPLNLENYLEIMNSTNILDKSIMDSQIVIQVEVLGPLEPHSMLNLVIHYEIQNPLGGIFYQEHIRDLSNLNKKEKYFYSDNFIGSERFWVPTVINQVYFITKISFSMPRNYQCLCSGDLEQETVEENGLLKEQVYRIDRKIQLNKIGFICGVFAHQQKNNFYLFYPQEQQQPLNQTLEFVDSLIVSYIRNYLEDFGKRIFKFVFMPGLQHSIQKQQKCLSFLDLAIVDEHYILDDRHIDKHQMNKREIFRSINMSLLQNIRLANQSQDDWIFTGFNNFLSDQFSINSEIEYKKLIMKLLKNHQEQVQQGEEIFVLSNENMGNNQFVGGLQQASEFYQSKCRLVFHMMTSFINCKKQIAKLIFSKTKLDTESFIKAIKHQFGIKKLNFFIKQFIKSTGMPEFFVNYNYHRKENKLQFLIKQKSVQEDYFKTQINNRLQLCDRHSIDCQILRQIMEDQKLAVPVFLKSLKFFYGKLNVFICETNEIDYKEENHNITIECKEENKILVHCRGKFRKTAQKKVTEFDEDLNSVKESSVHSSNLKKTQLFQMNNLSRNPTLWVKFDPENEYLQSNQIEMPENILLLHILKEKNGSVMFKLLDTLMNYVSFQSCNTLCSLFENKELDINLKTYIAKLLLRFCQLGAGWRGFDILYANLKTQSFESEHANSLLRPNDFSNQQDYRLKLVTIKHMVQIQNENPGDQKYYQSNLSQLLLKFLSQNDNSSNYYSDQHYVHTLLKSIFKLEVASLLPEILQEIIKSLNAEIANQHSHYQITLTVLQRLPNFLFINNVSSETIAQDYGPVTIGYLKRIRTKLKYLLQSYTPYLQAAYFRFKLHFKEVFRTLDFQRLLVYATQLLETNKERFLPANPKVIDAMSIELYEFVLERQEYYEHEMHMTSSKESQTQVAFMLWQQLVSGYSQISPVYRLSFLKIYRILYFYFTPICMLDNTSNTQQTNMYSIDLQWLQDPSEMSSQKTGLQTVKPNKIISLQQLNLSKKKRQENEKYKLNIKDLILGCFKTSSDQINWKSLAKSVVNLLLSEKTSESIEKELLNEEIEQRDEQNPSLGFVIKLKSSLNLRVIKKQILREYYDNLDQVEEDVLEVVHSYRKNTWLSHDAFQEYLVLLETLFQESKSILKEKAKIQNDKSDQKIMINITDLIQENQNEEEENG